MKDRDVGLTALERYLAYGAWALPVSGVLLVLGTLTHQPDYTTNFGEYAGYLTTGTFLASHLVASIVGAALAIVGTISIAGLVALRTARPGRVLLGTALSVAGHVLNTALYGVAAFAQPAIGRAHQDGVTGAVEINSDVYGPELRATAAVSLLLWTAGAVLIGTALRRSSLQLRSAGLAYAITLPVFFISGLPGGPVQPVVGGLFTLTAFVIARRLGTAADRTALESSVATACPSPAGTRPTRRSSDAY